MIVDGYSLFYYSSYTLDDNVIPNDVIKIQCMIDYYEKFLIFLAKNNNTVPVGVFCGGIEKDADVPDGVEYFIDFNEGYKLAYGNHRQTRGVRVYGQGKIKEIKHFINELKLLASKIQELTLKYNDRNTIMSLDKRINHVVGKVRKKVVKF